MTQGKLIGPAGSRPGTARSGGGIPGWFRRLRNLFHAAPVAISGDSSSVMDHYMKYNREHRG
jgi:hypothetical protein